MSPRTSQTISRSKTRLATYSYRGEVMIIVNKSEWRTEDFQALLDAAAAQCKSPKLPSFVICQPGYTSGAVDLHQDGDVLRISLNTSANGRRAIKRTTGLETLATGRMLDDGVFGQMARWIKLAFEPEEGSPLRDRRPNRSIPKWATGLMFCTREKADEKLHKTIDAICKSANLHNFRRHERYETLEDIAPHIAYARHAITSERKSDRESFIRRVEALWVTERKETATAARQRRYVSRVERVVAKRLAAKP